MFGIDNFRICPLRGIYVCNLIPKLIKRFADDSECVAFVMTLEIFHVLQQESSWTFSGNDPCHVKKEGALGFALKAVFTA
ncbi:hypothetical protein D3C86_2147800 [compost metagenome]